MIRPKPVESSLIPQILLCHTSKQSANPVNPTLKMYQASDYSLIIPLPWLWATPPSSLTNLTATAPAHTPGSCPRLLSLASAQWPEWSYSHVALFSIWLLFFSYWQVTVLYRVMSHTHCKQSWGRLWLFFHVSPFETLQGLSNLPRV